MKGISQFKRSKERSIWKNLGLALAATPVTALAFLVIVTLVGTLDDAIATIQLAGYWWVILVVAYILSFIYFLFESRVRRNRKRKEVVNGLVLYWREQIAKQGKPQPSDRDSELVSEMFLERVKVWGMSDPKLWTRRFRHEKYSEYLFDVVNNFMAYWESQKQYGENMGNG